MKTLFERSFAKDLKTITDKSIRLAISNALDDLSKAETLDAMTNCKKLHGTQALYRLRVGDYRLGIELRPDNTVIFVRCLHRKEMYRYFP
jgi:mRNA interferase RelE/StbE